MKKLLLSMCLAAAGGFMAEAGVTAIMCDNINYTGNAEVYRYPLGWQGDDMPLYTDAFTIDWETPTGSKMAMSIGSFHWYCYTEGILAPTPGVTINKVTMIVRDPDYFQSTIDGFTKNGNTYTWTGSLSYPDDLVIKPDFYDPKPEGMANINQPRPYIIEVEYTGTPTMPLMPVPSVTDRVIASDTPITLTSPTPGVNIYYTTDGEWPDKDATPYTGPITLSEDCVLKAVAVDSKNNISSILIQPYIVAEAGTTIVNYNLSTIDGLTLKNKTFAPHSSGEQIPLVDEYLDNEDVSIFVNSEIYTNTAVYIFAPASTCGNYGPHYYLLRVGAKGGITAEVMPNQVVTDVVFVGSGLKAANFLPKADDPGTMTYSAGDYIVHYSVAADSRSNSMTAYRKAGTVQFENIYVAYKDPNAAGIDAVEVDNSNAPVVYYNLQGMQMSGDNLTPGIYVKRQGDKAEKILVK